MSNKKQIALIAAVAADRTIGKDGSIPWSYQHDMERFKENTLDAPVIMGRHTFEGILAGLGKPLPSRTSIVLTSTPSIVPAAIQNTDTNSTGNHGSVTVTDDSLVYSVNTTDKAIRIAETHHSETIYIAGGERVYKQFIDNTDKMLLTHIHNTYNGDTHFPQYDMNNWRKTVFYKTDDYSFAEYTRVSNTTDKLIDAFAD